MIAAARGNTELIQLLRTHGAHVDAHNLVRNYAKYLCEIQTEALKKCKTILIVILYRWAKQRCSRLFGAGPRLR